MKQAESARIDNGNWLPAIPGLVLKRQHLLPTVLVLWTLFTAFFFGFAKKWNTLTNPVHCNADGSVHVGWFDRTGPDNAKYNELWASSSWLSITIGFGGMTFAEAKIVDIAWDLIVGRGGQLVLVTMAYPLMRQTMQLLARHSSGLFDVYCGLAFGPCSFWSTMLLIRRLRSGLGRAVYLRTLGLLALSIYIGLFPTLLSAMTSYQAKAEPYTQDDASGTFFPSSYVQPLNGFVLEQGSLLGLTDGFPVPRNSNLYPDILEYMRTYENSSNFGTENGYAEYDDGSPTYNTTTYSCKPATLCNITVSYNASGSYAMYSWKTSIRLLGHLYTTPDSIYMSNSSFTDGQFRYDGVYSNGYVYYQNSSYSEWSLSQATVCQPGKYYQWGFAYLFLFTFSIATEVVLWVALAMRIDVHRSTAGKPEQNFTLLKDIAQIAAALQRLIGGSDGALESMSVEKLAELADRHPRLVIHDDDKLELKELPPGMRKRKASGRTGRTLVKVGRTLTSDSWHVPNRLQQSEDSDSGSEDAELGYAGISKMKEAHCTEKPVHAYKGT